MPIDFDEKTGSLQIDTFSLTAQDGKAVLSANSYRHAEGSLTEIAYTRSPRDTVSLLNDLARKTAGAYRPPRATGIGKRGIQMSV